VYRIGLLATRPTPVIFDAFVAEMQKYGWTQGRDYTLESRFTEGYYQRAPALAVELVSKPVDILLTVNTANARVARDASGVIPIVMMTSGYPVEVGLAVSLARPRLGARRRSAITRPARRWVLDEAQAIAGPIAD
jgi:putative ABC transport system substrate-binding protein